MGAVRLGGDARLLARGLGGRAGLELWDEGTTQCVWVWDRALCVVTRRRLLAPAVCAVVACSACVTRADLFAQLETLTKT